MIGRLHAVDDQSRLVFALDDSSMLKTKTITIRQGYWKSIHFRVLKHLLFGRIVVVIHLAVLALVNLHPHDVRNQVGDHFALEGNCLIYNDLRNQVRMK